MAFDDGQLIELVQQFPVIYDKKHKNHKNKLVVENSFKTIGEVMGCAAEVCQQRRTNIWHRYAKERRALMNVALGTEDTMITRPYYHQCGFLDNIVIPRKTTSNITKVRPQTSVPGCSGIGSQRNGDMVWSSYSQIISQTDTASDEANEEGSEHFSNDGEEDADVTELSQDEEASQLRQKNSETGQKSSSKKRTDDTLETLTKNISGVFERMENLMTEPPTDTNTEQDNDAEFSFARSVASSLRNIPSVKKRLI